jgi:hypothetical protein
MSTVAGTPIFVNMGMVRMTDRECWLLLGTDVPGVTAGLSLAVVLSLQFAASLYDKLGAALQEYVRDAALPDMPAAPAMPFEPRLVRHLRDAEQVQDQARLPRSVVAEHASQITAWRTEGIPVPEIAARLHVSRSTVWRFLQYDGPRQYPGRGSKLDAHAEDIWAMRRRRRGYEVIAEAFHCTKTTVWMWCQKHPDPQKKVTSLEQHRRAAP